VQIGLIDLEDLRARPGGALGCTYCASEAGLAGLGVDMSRMAVAARW
jgi:hypothetical protein